MASETRPGVAAREWPFVLSSGLIAVAITFSLFYGTSFFRDMAIVFEGGYRIAGGQVPFRDFYTPGGIVVFYLQALAILASGANALSMVTHAAVLAAIVAMVLSLNGIFGNPGYSFVAYFFFDVICLLLLRRLDAAPVWPWLAVLLAVPTSQSIAKLPECRIHS